MYCGSFKRNSINANIRIGFIADSNGGVGWLHGQGSDSTVRQLVGADLIDQYYISVIPTLLGSGIRLFGNEGREIKLKLCSTQTYNGITDLVYTRR